MSRIDRLSALWRALLDFLFPQNSLAHFTAEAFARATQDAAHTQPLESHLPKETVVVFVYRHPVVRRCIVDLKYRGSRHAAKLLARPLADALLLELAEHTLFNESALSTLIVAVPLGKRRARGRGWNQTEILAQEVSLALGNSVAVLSGALARIRETKSQTRLSRAERFANVAGAFSVPYPERVRGKTILLLDDVITTGATIMGARRALLEAGAAHVICAAAAH